VLVGLLPEAEVDADALLVGEHRRLRLRAAVLEHLLSQLESESVLRVHRARLDCVDARRLRRRLGGGAVEGRVEEAGGELALCAARRRADRPRVAQQRRPDGVARVEVGRQVQAPAEHVQASVGRGAAAAAGGGGRIRRRVPPLGEERERGEAVQVVRLDAREEGREPRGEEDVHPRRDALLGERHVGHGAERAALGRLGQVETALGELLRQGGAQRRVEQPRGLEERPLLAQVLEAANFAAHARALRRQLAPVLSERGAERAHRAGEDGVGADLHDVRLAALPLGDGARRRLERGLELDGRREPLAPVAAVQQVARARLDGGDEGGGARGGRARDGPLRRGERLRGGVRRVVPRVGGPEADRRLVACQPLVGRLLRSAEGDGELRLSLAAVDGGEVHLGRGEQVQLVLRHGRVHHRPRQRARDLARLERHTQRLLDAEQARHVRRRDLADRVPDDDAWLVAPAAPHVGEE